MKSSIFLSCSIPHHNFTCQLMDLCTLKTLEVHVSTRKQIPTFYVEEGALIPLFRYWIYYIKKKIEILQKILAEQLNVDNYNKK
jgi:hypothetical protein